ncbi:MAG: site-2 protease family protein [Phycisphaerales bacterium]|nr:site-2 protease family protein [Phycisphaerales bacterium]
MNASLASISGLANLLLVVAGFGLVIFIHEMGHFLTARWAGIRVFAFALGFGPAVVSYRRGLGWRKGSSEQEYLALCNDATGPAGDRRESARARLGGKVSPTEYRLNALPFGGYVKMLGQNDINPEATATAPDSYLAKPIWKRMIVISGGVVMNIILALVVFMLVFFVGLKTEPPTIGTAYPDGPSISAIATNAAELGVTEPGLHSGDVVTQVNGRKPDDFNDIAMAGAMAAPGEPVRLVIDRPGLTQPLRFDIVPERSQFNNMLDLGVDPARSLQIPPNLVATPAEWQTIAAHFHLTGVEPGMRVVRIGPDRDLHSAGDLTEAARNSGGSPFQVEFASPAGESVTIDVTPAPELMLDDANPDPAVLAPIEHLLGLMPVMKVGPFGDRRRGYDLGLREGDIFARLGDVEFPSVEAGIAEVQRHRGRDIQLTVLRGTDGADTPPEEISLKVRVGDDGLIGFRPSDTAHDSALVTLAPTPLHALKGGASFTPAAVGQVTRPGSRVLEVAGRPVTNFADLRTALVAATKAAHESGAASASVSLTLALPLPPQPDGAPITQTVDLSIPREQIDRLQDLSWRLPFPTSLFAPEEFTLKATGPVDAIRMGVARTQRMMTMTYLTIARLAQGTVKVESLKGPVGIAHLGTQVATRGIVWLIFFMGLISVNLAVINFLPLPIADGGQFLMLLYEQIRGRPLPIAVQNAITAIGLVLLVSLFLLVTYNDVSRLFTG